MIEVEITIGGHKFRIVCSRRGRSADSVAKLLDKALFCNQLMGVPETKMLLMVGLMLATRLNHLSGRRRHKKDLIIIRD